MGYQIDFLNIGENSRCGDAICLRYGNLFGDRTEQRVVVIDGGFTDDGKRVIDHLQTYYSTDRVHVVVSTHPDADHINGLATVLTELDVGCLLMNRPWQHSGGAALAKVYGFAAFPEKIAKSLTGAVRLEEIATERGIPILAGLAGTRLLDDTLHVLGPGADFYEECVEQFALAQTVNAADQQGFLAKAKAAAIGVLEGLHVETLTDAGTTSASNDSSVILAIDAGDRWLLFTGDAGMPALEGALTHLDSAWNFLPGDFDFVQVPHHGSRRNVGPSVLDRILGPKGTSSDAAGRVAIVSASAGCEDHPSKRVMNAFTRRGYAVAVTQGITVCHNWEAPDRGWAPIQPQPLHTAFDERPDD